MFQDAIGKLISYANDTGILPVSENVYALNQVLALLEEDSFEGDIPVGDGSTDIRDLPGILGEILDYAAGKGLLPDNTVTYRDLFDSRIMNCVMPRPAEVIRQFYERYDQDKKAATDWFYKFSQDVDYIRRYRLEKDVRYTVDSKYGPIVITINLSKPEKDPKAIAAAGRMASSSYPKCQLCRENEGYLGRVNHPGRSNHRIIPMRLAGADWGFQYSPYGYYNEHCILLNMEHVPMIIERATFEKLLGFVEVMPHYMLGSNADLPIVGGSILSHDHYQGGRFDFPMALAAVAETVEIPDYPDISVGIVNWPLTCIRLQGKEKTRIIDLAQRILQAWRGYSDEPNMIFAETDGVPHNTITPIARMKDGEFQLDLVLRNNLTTEDRPLGLYHPRPEYHHIKKENIGLIEVMGMAVLPARLKDELQMLRDAILSGEDLRQNPAIEKHADWAEQWIPEYPELQGFSRLHASGATDRMPGTVTKERLQEIIDREVGKVFAGVLEDCGVYPATEEGRAGVKRFLATI
ncbi:MAG: UDP-glucose--hexose-1-phosphate uridylyltransferase [Lachnospiraceae bacterium]|nr:UDP-glucose--hexose-1-phosphate uridylyltransferase [Lachnospiraceae bacterium]